MPFAFIHYFEKPEWERPERPVDPGWGIEGGRPDHGFNPDYPSQGLPGRPEYPSQGPVRPGYPGRPGQGLPHPGRPVDPDWGLGEEGPGQLPVFPPPGIGQLPILPGGEHPSHGLPRPPLNKPIYPGGAPGQLPVFPESPDQGLPPHAGQLPGELPPGTIWPPIGPDHGLPPSFPPGKAIVVAGIPGVGWRYIIVTIPPAVPGQGLPGAGRPGVAPLPSR